MKIEELKAVVEKLDLAVDHASGQILVEWNKVPFSEPDRPFWAALSSIEGVGPQVLAVLIIGLGSARQVFETINHNPSSLGVPKRVSQAITRFQKDHHIPTWFDQICRKNQPNLSLIAAAEKSFPERLKLLKRGPSQLWVWGDPSVFSRRYPVAIVGTRKITPYGREVTGRLASRLASRGCIIVSGLMYGVDEAAMRAALNAGGRVIGVWAGGLTVKSLGSRLRLASDIVRAGGTIVAEFAPHQLPNRGLFPTRNRIVSGLSQAVLVTEGATRSGSLITARHGLEQGRPVFAVPGPITSPLSAGPNELLKLGAQAVTSADDIVELLSGPTARSRPGQSTYDPKDESESAVISALKEHPMTIDQLVRETSMSVGQVSQVLVELELNSAVHQMGDEWVC